MAFHKTGSSVNAKPKESAFQKIIAMASRKEIASANTRTRLLEYGYTESEANLAIERAIDYGIIDDQRFAECYLRSRVASGKGVYGALQDLERLGIEFAYEEELQDQIYELELEEEERAFQLLCSKPPRSKNQRDGAYRKLILQGYSSQIASSAAKRWFAEHGNAW